MRTISEIATEYGKTKQAAMVWRSKAEEKYGQLPFTVMGKRKLYDTDSIEKILEFAPGQESVVIAEIVEDEDRPQRGGMLALMNSANASGSRVSALTKTQLPDSSMALARQSLESKADLDTAISNTVLGLGQVSGLAQEIGTHVVKQFGSELRTAIASGLDTEIRGVLEQFGLGQQPPQQ